jgi:hypothetical protein
MCNCGKDRSKFRDKMGTIKHDDSKFQNVNDLYESGHNKEEIIHESLALYQLRHPKAANFAFEHRWLILREVPRWAELWNNSARTPESLKKKSFATLRVPSNLVMPNKVAGKSIRSASVTHQPQTSSSNRSKIPPGIKQAKEDLGNGRTCEQVVYAQVQASLEMRRTTHIKALICKT